MRIETPESLAALDAESLTYALKAGYLHAPSERFLWYSDGMQYMNHGRGLHANVGLHYWPELEHDHIVALRDISCGEELREDYGYCLAAGLGSDHWMRPLYLDHCRDHYEFLLGLKASIDPRGSSKRVGKNSRTVAISASSRIGFEITQRNPEAKHAA